MRAGLFASLLAVTKTDMAAFSLCALGALVGAVAYLNNSLGVHEHFTKRSDSAA